MDGIEVTQPATFSNDTGSVLRAMSIDDHGFSGFAEAYFSTVNQGKFKDWRKHSAMTANLLVIEGCILFHLYNETSREYQKIEMSINRYLRMTIYPGVWFAFEGMLNSNILLNIANMKHDPHEVIKLNKIDFENKFKIYI